MDQYFQILQSQFEQIRQREWPKIAKAADWLAEALINNKFLYAFGTGHSHMLAEEIFYRAGGLARACPMLDENLMLHKEAIEATYLERKEGYAKKFMDLYPVEPGDLLIVASNSGRNAVPIEMALEGKSRGLRVIAVTSVAHAKKWGSRHPTGKTLAQVADLTIDNCALPGDACVKIDGLDQLLGSTTTSTGALIINSIIVQGIQNALNRGATPEVFISSNSNGDNHNDRLLQKYKSRVRHL